jgi:hypothetical protein
MPSTDHKIIYFNSKRLSKKPLDALCAIFVAPVIFSPKMLALTPPQRPRPLFNPTRSARVGLQEPSTVPALHNPRSSFIILPPEGSTSLLASKKEETYERNKFHRFLQP